MPRPDRKQVKARALRAEVLGLLLLALGILIAALVRWGSRVPWGAH